LTIRKRSTAIDAQRKEGSKRKAGEEGCVVVPDMNGRSWLRYAAARSSGGGGRKKLTAYNKFMQTEMARLKEHEPDMSHQAR